MGKWTIMGTGPEREAFWRSHHEAWRRSDLNQREYCETHGLVLKRFENWRAKIQHEPANGTSPAPRRRPRSI